MGCVGNRAEACGGAGHINIFSNGNNPAFPAQTVQSVGGWTLKGCFTDTPSSRTLGNKLTLGRVTVEACVASCATAGFTFAGVEDSSECWCDHAMSTSATPSSFLCKNKCLGNSREICGGSSAMNVYELTGSNTAPITSCPVTWSSTGCFSDNPSNRALSFEVIAGGATVESCTAACAEANFLYAGLEYFGQCFCDNMLNHASVADPSFCNTPCSADASETCGGAPYLSIYAGAYEPGCLEPSTCSFSSAGCYV